MKNEFRNTDSIEIVDVPISRDHWRNFGDSPLWRNSKCKTKTTFESNHNKIAIEWFDFELRCSAVIMPVFWNLLQILAILIENNILKSRLIFVFRFRTGKKIEKTIQMKYFKIKSLFFDNEKGNTQSTFKSTMIQFFVKENKNQRKEWVCMNLFVYQSVSFWKTLFLSFSIKESGFNESENEWWMNNNFYFKRKRYIKTFQFFYKKIGNKVKVSSKNESTIAMKVDFYILVRI
jgi:hypothetical protein